MIGDIVEMPSSIRLRLMILMNGRSEKLDYKNVHFDPSTWATD